LVVVFHTRRKADIFWTLKIMPEEDEATEGIRGGGGVQERRKGLNKRPALSKLVNNNCWWGWVLQCRS